MSPDTIASNLAQVRSRIAAAARRAGRDPAGVTLIAVSKTFDAAHVRAAMDAGQRDFGENRVQEALDKMAAVTAPDDPLRWHLIGHLQSNKARKAAARFAAIHSVDSVDLLQRLDLAAREQGATPDLLIQVDLAGEATKFGAEPDALPPILEAAAGCTAVRLVGLMTLPPLTEKPEDGRPYFRRLRELRDALDPSGRLPHLSMGMSHDLDVAVEEGATMVRVGTAIFGARG